ncbi:MAG: hypothetical protein O7F73_13595 [Gammaproteobacteria bacterium]|nr:hypothetical protein [Gammaproteobacteria bacterium]
MDNDKKSSKDTETILMALDQISQTIEVMTSVVGRLRTYLQEQESATADTGSKNSVTQIQGSGTVH